MCSFLDLSYMRLSVFPGLECFLYHVREVFSYYLFKYFLRSFSLFSFWDPYNMNEGAFNVVPVVSQTALVSSHSSLLCSAAMISTGLSSSSLIHASASFILLLIPPNVFLIFQLSHHSSLFFKVSISFLNISCIISSQFLYSFPEILDHLYYCYSEFFFWWIFYLYFILWLPATKVVRQRGKGLGLWE